MGIKVVSVGNLILGGSGKTPLIIQLAKPYQNIAVVLRGYGRKSKGLYIVSQNGNILEDVQNSGDEARLLANSLPNATIIVSEDKTQAILKAKELGCKMVFLDDGYSLHKVKKLDILIRPQKEPTNLFCLPSGGYRETKMMYAFADIVLKEGEDFNRIVTFKQNDKPLVTLPKNIVLLTAISKPYRLLTYLPDKIKTEIFIDHHNFTKKQIDTILQKYKNFTIITTAKDLVKLEQFNMPNIILMDLEIQINKNIKIDYE
jgi:tetraacyldisaccharide 4'-kinase